MTPRDRGSGPAQSRSRRTLEVLTGAAGVSGHGDAGPGPDRRAFVGRDAELNELRRALAEATQGRGSLFLVSGEPGIGKTRLAEELLARAAEAGVLGLRARCWEG